MRPSYAKLHLELPLVVINLYLIILKMCHTLVNVWQAVDQSQGNVLSDLQTTRLIYITLLNSRHPSVCHKIKSRDDMWTPHSYVHIQSSPTQFKLHISLPDRRIERSQQQSPCKGHVWSVHQPCPLWLHCTHIKGIIAWTHWPAPGSTHHSQLIKPWHSHMKYNRHSFGKVAAGGSFFVATALPERRTDWQSVRCDALHPCTHSHHINSFNIILWRHTLKSLYPSLLSHRAGHLLPLDSCQNLLCLWHSWL